MLKSSRNGSEKECDTDCRAKSDKAAIVLERIADGESVNAICQESGMPAARTIFRRAQQDEEFRKDYDLACQVRAERYADKLADLAQHCTTPEQVQGLKLMVNTRQWVISKLLPRKFGDSPQLVNTYTQNNVVVFSQEKQCEVQEALARLREKQLNQ